MLAPSKDDPKQPIQASPQTQNPLPKTGQSTRQTPAHASPKQSQKHESRAALDSGRDTLREEGITTAWSEIPVSELIIQTHPFENDDSDTGSLPPSAQSRSNSPEQQAGQYFTPSDEVKAILNTLQKQNEIVESSNDQALMEFFKAYQPHNKEIINIHGVLQSEYMQLKRYKKAVYFGEIINGQRYGQGIMMYPSGGSYEGSWQNNLRFGLGFELFSSGNRYEGYYVNGKMEGVGTYVWLSGEIYNGQWLGGMRHGSGSWRSPNNDQYVGEWKFGKADGYGVKVMENGDRFEGQMKAGMKHGDGLERFSRGDQYVGSFFNDKPEGEGEFTWKSGQNYKGSFKNGLKHGMGMWKKSKDDPNCDRYEGNFLNDKKCGTGTFRWSSGNEYRGNYFDELRHGYGEMYWTDGTVYKGQWEKGKQSGEGKLYLNGALVRAGYFKDDEFQGEQKSIDQTPQPVNQSIDTHQRTQRSVDFDRSSIQVESKPKPRNEIRRLSASKQQSQSIDRSQPRIDPSQFTPNKNSNVVQNSNRPNWEIMERNVDVAFNPNSPDGRNQIILPPIRKSIEQQKNTGESRYLPPVSQTEADSSARRVRQVRTPSMQEREKSLPNSQKRIREKKEHCPSTESDQEKNDDGKTTHLYSQGKEDDQACNKKYPSFQLATPKTSKQQQLSQQGSSSASRVYQSQQFTPQQAQSNLSEKISQIRGSSPFLYTNSPNVQYPSQHHSSSNNNLDIEQSPNSNSALSNRNANHLRRRPQLYWGNTQRNQETIPIPEALPNLDNQKRDNSRSNSKINPTEYSHSPNRQNGQTPENRNSRLNNERNPSNPNIAPNNPNSILRDPNSQSNSPHSHLNNNKNNPNQTPKSIKHNQEQNDPNTQPNRQNNHQKVSNPNDNNPKSILNTPKSKLNSPKTQQTIPDYLDLTNNTPKQPDQPKKREENFAQNRPKSPMNQQNTPNLRLNLNPSVQTDHSVSPRNRQKSLRDQSTSPIHWGESFLPRSNSSLQQSNSPASRTDTKKQQPPSPINNHLKSPTSNANTQTVNQKTQNDHHDKGIGTDDLENYLKQSQSEASQTKQPNKSFLPDINNPQHFYDDDNNNASPNRIKRSPSYLSGKSDSKIRRYGRSPSSQVNNLKSPDQESNLKNRSPSIDQDQFEYGASDKLPQLKMRVRPLEKYELILWEKLREKNRIPEGPYLNTNDPKVINKIRALLHPPVWRPPGVAQSPEVIKQKDMIYARDMGDRRSMSPSPERNSSPYQ